VQKQSVNVKSNVFHFITGSLTMKNRFGYSQRSVVAIHNELKWNGGSFHVLSNLWPVL